MIHLYHYNTKNTISQLFKEFSIFCGENLNSDNLIICDIETYKFINFQLIPFYKKYKLAKNNLIGIENINFEKLAGKRYKNIIFIDYLLNYNKMIKSTIQRFCLNSEIHGITYTYPELIKISKEVDFYKKENCSKKEIELIMVLKNNFSKHIVNFLLDYDLKCEQISNFNEIKKYWKT